MLTVCFSFRDSSRICPQNEAKTRGNNSLVFWNVLKSLKGQRNLEIISDEIPVDRMINLVPKHERLEFRRDFLSTTSLCSKNVN